MVPSGRAAGKDVVLPGQRALVQRFDPDRRQVDGRDRFDTVPLTPERGSNGRATQP
jgi:hypothetical protein